MPQTSPRTGKKQQNPPNELIARRPGQRRWTAEQRAERAAKIRETKPWLKSTGPKTAGGKAVSRWNSYRHGMKSAQSLRFRHALREQARFLASLNKSLAKPRVSPYKPRHQGLWEVTPALKDHWGAAPQTSFLQRSKPFGFPQGARSKVYDST